MCEVVVSNELSSSLGRLFRQFASEYFAIYKDAYSAIKITVIPPSCIDAVATPTGKKLVIQTNIILTPVVNTNSTSARPKSLNMIKSSLIEKID